MHPIHHKITENAINQDPECMQSLVSFHHRDKKFVYNKLAPHPCLFISNYLYN